MIKFQTSILSFEIHSVNYYYPDYLPIFVSTRHKPIQLLNGLNDDITSTYNLLNDKEEFISPFSLLQFNEYLLVSHVSSLYFINIQDNSHITKIPLCPTKRSKNYQKGLIHSIDFNNHYLTCGSLSHSIGFYSLSSPSYPLEILLTDLPSSVIQLKWLNDDILLVNFRMFDYLYIYNVNDLSQPVCKLFRPGSTNQKLFFSVKLNWLCYGDTNGYLNAFNLALIPDLNSDVSSQNIDESDSELDLKPNYSFKLSNYSINSVNFHPNLNIISISCGNRIDVTGDSSDSDNDNYDSSNSDNDNDISDNDSDSDSSTQLVEKSLLPNSKQLQKPNIQLLDMNFLFENNQ